MMVRLKGKPVDVVIVEVYMPTTEHKDEEIDAAYERIQELLDKETKGMDYMLIIGDWNAIVGEGKEDVFVGHYGLGYGNNRGEKFAEFYEHRQMYVINTWFTQDSIQKYTWTMPQSKSPEGQFQMIIHCVSKKFPHLNCL